MRSMLVILAFALAILSTGCGSDTSQSVSTPVTTADTTSSTSTAPAATKPSETTSAQSAHTQSTTPVQPSAPPTYKPRDSTSALTAFVAKVDAVCRRRDQQLAAEMKQNSQANATAGGDVHAAEQLFLQPEQARIRALEALQPPAYARVRYDRFTSALQTRLRMLGELMPVASNDPKAMRVAQSVERLSEQAASAATSLGISCSS